MPQAISFPNGPAAGFKIPLFWADFASTANPGTQQQRALLVVQTLTAQPNVPVHVPTTANAIALFGAGSNAAAMVQKYRAGDPLGELLVLPFADNGTTKAIGNLSFTGPASAAGVLALYVAGRAVPVAVTSGMTATGLATAVIAAVNAYLDTDGCALPVTALVDGTHAYQVNLTARHAGTIGNGIDIRLNYYGPQGSEVTPGGITVAVTAMSGGATDPDITGLDAILGDENYDFIAMPWATAAALNATQTLMSVATGRWSYLRQVYGHVFTAKMDADATGATNLTFGATRNDAHATVVSYEPAPSPPWDVAAAYCAAAAVSLRADPARPLQTLLLPGLLAPAATGRYTKATQQALLSTGMALMGYNPDTSCTILRAVTTYQKNAFGSPDLSYLDAETAFTLMAFVRFLKAGLTTKFPRAKLVDDGTNFGAGTSFSNGAPDASVVTPKSAAAETIALYAQMCDLVWVEDVETFARGLIVQRNAQDPSRLDFLVDPILASGLRIMAILNRFFLSSDAAAAFAA